MPNTAFVLNGQVGQLAPDQALAGSGKYYVVTNPTPGTAIAYALQTAFSATANGLFAIQNTDLAGGTSVYLDYLKLIQTATVPTGCLVMRFEAFNETGSVTLTGNVATRTPVSLGNGAAPSTVTVQSFAAGAATVPAAVGTRRLQSIAAINTSAAVVHDQYVIQFGAGDIVGGTAGLTAVRATASATIVGQAAPVVVPPASTTWINMWWVTAAANTPSFEFELGFSVL